jgi:hypothetical protein
LDYVLAKSKASIAMLNVDAELAGMHRQVKDASAFLRESPSVAVSAGPRTGPGLSGAMDQTVEIDAPLMLRRGPARHLASRLNAAVPVLMDAADIENRLEIHKAFLDAWTAELIDAIRAEDGLLVREWLGIAEARSESGTDPAFQLELVKGELLKSHMDMEDSNRARVRAWASLAALSDLPKAPQPLDHHPDEDAMPLGHGAAESEARYQNGALRRAAVARQGLEMGRINLHAAQSNSRFSISGSYTKENDERVAKIGLAYRFPRSGEVSAIRAERRAQAEASGRGLELALAELDLRFRTAVRTMESSRGCPKVPDAAASMEALTLRLREGKDRPSDAIPVRRQFLEMRIRELQRKHSLYLAQAELSALTADAPPPTGRAALRAAGGPP